MQILIDGKDISDFVTVSSCIHEDRVSGRSDALSISFNDDTDSETNWRDWNLDKGTEIEVRTDQFRSGIMYVSRITHRQCEIRQKMKVRSHTRMSHFMSFFRRGPESLL